VSQAKKTMGVQQVLLSPDAEVKALLEYLCQQSGKLYNSGVYFARQTLFKTGKILNGKFDLSVEPSVAKSMVARSLPSTPMQQTLMSVTEAFKSFKELRNLYIEGQLYFKPKPPSYLTGSKLFKVAYPIKRGLYRSNNGSIVNADLNGAANILRKVASNLSLDLGLLGRRCLTTVARVRLWVLPKLAWSAESQCL
jgi:hypothetical protein